MRSLALGLVTLGVVAAGASPLPHARVLDGARSVAAARWIILGHHAATGRHATATAGAAKFEALTVAVQVRARPSQRIHVSWQLSCVSLGGPQVAHGRFATHTSRPRVLGHTNGGVCAATATARLAKRGQLTVRLLGR